jgi:hypothetical protein
MKQKEGDGGEDQRRHGGGSQDCLRLAFFAYAVKLIA